MTTPICTDADLNARYGTTNIARWADLEGTWAEGEAESADMTARRLLARTRATDLVYDRLRASQLNMNLPLSTAPSTLVDVTVKIAGWWLSSARGVSAYDQAGNPISRWYADFRDAMGTLDKIVAQELRLDV